MDILKDDPSTWSSVDLLKNYEYVTILHHGGHYIDGGNPHHDTKNKITKELARRLGISHKEGKLFVNEGSSKTINRDEETM